MYNTVRARKQRRQPWPVKWSALLALEVSGILELLAHRVGTDTRFIEPCPRAGHPRTPMTVNRLPCLSAAMFDTNF